MTCIFMGNLAGWLESLCLVHYLSADTSCNRTAQPRGQNYQSLELRDIFVLGLNERVARNFCGFAVEISWQWHGGGVF